MRVMMICKRLSSCVEYLSRFHILHCHWRNRQQHLGCITVYPPFSNIAQHKRVDFFCTTVVVCVCPSTVWRLFAISYHFLYFLSFIVDTLATRSFISRLPCVLFRESFLPFELEPVPSSGPMVLFPSPPTSLLHVAIIYFM